MSIALAVQTPTDRSGLPVDLLTYFGGKSLSVTDTTANTAFPAGSGAVCLYAVGACFIKFGDETVEAASNSFDVVMASGSYFIHPKSAGVTHLAAIRMSADSTLYVMGIK